MLIFSLILTVFAVGCKKEEENNGNDNPTPPVAENTVKDIDGNVYKTVNINGLTWMAENLKVETFNNGTPITKCDSIEAYTEIATNQTPAFCYYDCQDANKAIHGALYNGWAIQTDKLCPQGWHVASTEDWNNLITFAGGSSAAPLKLMTTTGWTDNNGTAVYGTDEFGFAAKASGTLHDPNDGTYVFRNLGKWAYWNDGTNCYFYMSAASINNERGEDFTSAANGLSVRCVKD